MSDIRTSHDQPIGQYLIRLGLDWLLWAFCVFAIGFLHGAGVIESPGSALAGAALFMAIRARSKSEVNSAHTEKVGN